MPAASAAPLPAGDGPALLKEADRAYAQDNLARAAQLYRAAAQKGARGVEPHYKLGVVLALRGDLPGAVAAWQKVLELDPSMKAAKDNIARARRKMSSLAEQGVDDPALSQDTSAQLSLATRYLDEGRLSMAMRVLDPLTDQNPEDVKVRLLRGQALLLLGRLDEARLNLELALGLDPGDAQVLATLGQLYLRLDDDKRALYFLRRYLDRADPEGKDSALDDTRRTVARLEGRQEP